MKTMRIPYCCSFIVLTIPTLVLAQSEGLAGSDHQKNIAAAWQQANTKAENQLWASFDPIQKSALERSGRTLYGSVKGATCSGNSDVYCEVLYDASASSVERHGFMPITSTLADACNLLKITGDKQFRNGISTTIQRSMNFSPKVEVSECLKIEDSDVVHVSWKYFPKN